MNPIKFAITIISLIIILSGVAVSQRRSRSKPRPVRAAPTPAATPTPIKRLVTVNLKEGAPVKGYFLSADADAVQVELKNGKLAIKLNEVASLLFTPYETSVAKPREEPSKEAPPAAQDPVLPNARQAYTALRKLADAAQLGLPYVQYANLLIEVRPAVDQALAALPEGAVKSDVAAAMESYTDAGQAWGVMLGKGGLPIAAEPGATLMKKYAIKPAVNALGQESYLPIDLTLSTIWMAAGARLNNIAVLLKQ